LVDSALACTNLLIKFSFLCVSFLICNRDYLLINSNSFSAEEAKQKFYKLHEALVINMDNEQVLMKKARSLQKELSIELLKLEKT